MMTGYIDNNTIRDVQIDRYTRALSIVDYAHHEAHDGNFYFIKNWFEVTNNEPELNLVQTVVNNEEGKRPHVGFIIKTDAEFNLTIYKNVVLSDNGTEVDAQNVDFESPNVHLHKVYSNPTLLSGSLGDGADGGTSFWRGKAGDGRDAGETRNTSYEFIPARGFNYWFRAQKQVSGTRYLDVDFFWYEEGPKDDPS